MKNKFIKAYLTKDEWEAIKIAMAYYEYLLNDRCEKYVLNDTLHQLYKVIEHFNKEGVETIESQNKKGE